MTVSEPQETPRAISEFAGLPEIPWAALSVYALPMTEKFRGITVREGVLLEGPRGWGDFCPFPEYDDEVAAVWLAAALEAAWLDPSPNFFANLGALQQYSLLPTATGYWAHALRRTGNAVRHVQRRTRGEARARVARGDVRRVASGERRLHHGERGARGQYHCGGAHGTAKHGCIGGSAHGIDAAAGGQQIGGSATAGHVRSTDAGWHGAGALAPHWRTGRSRSGVGTAVPKSRCASSPPLWQHSPPPDGGPEPPLI